MIVGKFHFKDYGFEDKRAVDEKGNPITSLDWTIVKAYAPYSWQRKFVNTILKNGINNPKQAITPEDKAKAIDKALGFASPEFLQWLETAEEGQRSKKGMILYNNKKRFYKLFGIDEVSFHLVEHEHKQLTKEDKKELMMKNREQIAKNMEKQKEWDYLSLCLKFFEQSTIELGNEERIKNLKTKFLISDCSDEFSSICLDVMKFIKVSVYETSKMKIDSTEMVEITNKMIELSSKEPELKDDILKSFQSIPLIFYVFMCNNDMIEGTEDTYSEAISISIGLTNIFAKV